MVHVSHYFNSFVLYKEMPLLFVLNCHEILFMLFALKIILVIVILVLYAAVSLGWWVIINFLTSFYFN